MENEKKKPGIAVMIALSKMKKGKVEEPDMSVDAARELLDAIQADDEKKFANLLKDFIHACSDPEEEEEDDPEVEGDY